MDIPYTGQNFLQISNKTVVLLFTFIIGQLFVKINRNQLGRIFLLWVSTIEVFFILNCSRFPNLSIN